MAHKPSTIKRLVAAGLGLALLLAAGIAWKLSTPAETADIRGTDETPHAARAPDDGSEAPPPPPQVDEPVEQSAPQDEPPTQSDLAETGGSADIRTDLRPATPAQLEPRPTGARRRRSRRRVQHEPESATPPATSPSGAQRESSERPMELRQW